MNIGASSNDTAYLLMGGIAALFVVPLLLAVIALSARFFAWVLRIQSGWFFAGWWIFWIGGLIVGTSLYMDVGAAQLTGTVVEKTEQVELQREGDWDINFTAALDYPYAGGTGHVSLRIGEAEFDALQKGGEAELQVAPLYKSIVLVRLAAISTVSWLATPLRWLGIALLIGVAIWQAEKIKSQRAWIAIAVVGLLVAIAMPTYLTYGAWQRADDLASRPLRAQANVTAVQRITNIDYFPCESDCGDSIDTAFDVPQQYDIVQMTFLPDGRREPVLATDSADAGSLVTFVGDTITIAYAADDPRDAQIIDATHSHHWRNVIFFVWTSVATAVLLFCLRFFVHWGIEKIGQRLAARV
jgi:hypothetical protein